MTKVSFHYLTGEQTAVGDPHPVVKLSHLQQQEKALGSAGLKTVVISQTSPQCSFTTMRVQTLQKEDKQHNAILVFIKCRGGQCGHD